jgi:uncharacterized protein (TIGR03000 family)
MFRHVIALALIAVVLLVGANVASACCWGGWGGCGWGGGCCYSYCAPCYSYCAPSYSHCGYGHCGVGYYGGHGHHYAAAPVAAPAYASAARATLVVSLPADATLYVDGQRTTTTSGQRTFSTPALDSGKTYFYTLTAEVNRGGVARTVTEKVYVRPNQTTQVSLSIPETGSSVASR